MEQISYAFEEPVAYNPNDPKTYGIRFVVRNRTNKRFLCRDSFGYSWEPLMGAELFSYNQAIALLAGRHPSVTGPVENSDIIDAVENFEMKKKTSLWTILAISFAMLVGCIPFSSARPDSWRADGICDVRGCNRPRSCYLTETEDPSSPITEEFCEFHEKELISLSKRGDGLGHE